MLGLVCLCVFQSSALRVHSVFVCIRTSDVDRRQARLFPSCRLTLTIIGFFMFVHLYAQRVGMSVAIVCMVNHTAVRQLHITQILSDDGHRYERESSNISVTVSEVQTSRCGQQNYHENNDNNTNDGIQKVCCENVLK